MGCIGGEKIVVALSTREGSTLNTCAEVGPVVLRPPEGVVKRTHHHSYLALDPQKDHST